MLRIGSIVMLRSGGPQMTVRKIDPAVINGASDTILVNWFDDKQACQFAEFPTEMLKVRKDNEWQSQQA